MNTDTGPARVRGKFDKLYSLKENVITGRKIPVITGFDASNALDEGIVNLAKNYIRLHSWTAKLHDHCSKFFNAGS
jgi:hypothetical protein